METDLDVMREELRLAGEACDTCGLGGLPRDIRDGLLAALDELETLRATAPTNDEQGELMDYEMIAQVAYTANAEYDYRLTGKQPPIWDDLPSDTREGYIRAVSDVQTGITRTPQAVHDLWVAVRERDGWTYGPVKDAERREHPNLVPWDELSEVEQRKDVMFLGIVRALTGGVPVGTLRDGTPVE